MQTQDVPLRKFRLSRIPDNSTCVVVAPTRGGKTTLGIDLLYHKRHIPSWFLFSTSEGCSSRLSQTIPPLYHYPTLDLKVLKKVYDYQPGRLARYTRKRSESERKRIPDDELPIKERFRKNPCVGVYFEDCFADKKEFKKVIVQDLMKNGRHRMFFSVIPCQDLMDLDVSVRKQVKFYFIFKDDNGNSCYQFYHNLARSFCSRELWDAIYNRCTADYGCVVIDNLSKSSRLQDRIFWYRARIHNRAFKVGSRRLWKFHEKNYKKEKGYTEEELEARHVLGRLPQNLPQDARQALADAIALGAGVSGNKRAVGRRGRKGLDGGAGGGGGYGGNKKGRTYDHVTSVDAYANGQRILDNLAAGCGGASSGFSINMVE